MDQPPSFVPEGRRASAVSTLRRFAAGRKSEPIREGCELCSINLAPEHRHLLETASHKIFCACDPCALRFELVLDGRFKLIPRDAHSLPDTPDSEPIHSVILQAQIQFQVTHRRYSATEKEKFTELFGTPERWGDTFERLYAYRRVHGLASWDQTLEQLLPALETTEVQV